MKYKIFNRPDNYEKLLKKFEPPLENENIKTLVDALKIILG